MDEEQYAALLAKIAELEARIESQSHHGMDHGAGDAMDNGVMFREVKLVPTAKPEVATLYLQDNGATNQLMLQHPTGAAIWVAPQDLNTGASPTFIRMTLSQATGTAPLTIASTTAVINLNADLLDGNHASAFEASIALSTANYLYGMNAAANAKEWKSLVGTSNRVTVTHGANLITLSGPQDLHTTAAPQFNNINCIGGANAQGHFEGAAAAAGYIELWGKHASNGTYQKWEIQSIPPDNGTLPSCLLFYDRTDNRFAMVLDTSGYLGLGTYSPSAQFHNTGTVRMQNFGAGTATFDANGNVSSVSDVRHKAVLGKFTAGLAEITKLQPIRYRWNELSGLETEHEYAGFSAQDVERVIPLAIGRNQAGYLSLQDRALMAAMVNAIKELKAEIDQLKRVN